MRVFQKTWLNVGMLWCKQPCCDNFCCTLIYVHTLICCTLIYVHTWFTYGIWIWYRTLIYVYTWFTYLIYVNYRNALCSNLRHTVIQTIWVEDLHYHILRTCHSNTFIFIEHVFLRLSAYAVKVFSLFPTNNWLE